MREPPCYVVQFLKSIKMEQTIKQVHLTKFRMIID
jgi:hypothetical protein